MFEAGELDALLSLYIPNLFLNGSPLIARLFPNARAGTGAHNGAAPEICEERTRREFARFPRRSSCFCRLWLPI